MTAVQGPFNFQKYSYQVNLEDLEITAKEHTLTLQETITSLFQCKNKLEFASSAISLKNLDRFKILTQAVIKEVEKTLSKQYWYLFYSTPRNDPTLNRLKELDIIATKKCIEKEQQALNSMQEILAEKDLKRKLQQIGNLFAAANQSIQQQQTYIQAAAFFKKEISNILVDCTKVTPSPLCTNASLIDPKLEWLEGFVKLEPPEDAIGQIKLALDKARQITSPLDSETKFRISLVLHITNGALQHTNITSLNALKTSLLFKKAYEEMRIANAPIDWKMLIDTLKAFSLYPGNEVILVAFCISAITKSTLFDQRSTDAVTSGIKTLLERKQEYNWLKWFEEALKINNNELETGSKAQEVFERILAPFDTFFRQNVSLCEQIDSVMKRMKQIEALPDEKRCLTKVEMYQIASYIEGIVFTFSMTDQVFRRKDTHLARSLQRDGLTGDIFILSKQDVTFFKPIQGATKKPQPAIRLPANVNMAAEDYCQTVNKSDVKILAIMQSLRNEVGVHTLLSGSRGIWPIATSCEYTKIKNDVHVPKISSLSPLADGTLDRVLHSACDFPALTILYVMQDLAYGLLAMHQKGYVHGDLKPSNALIRVFSFSSKVNTKPFHAIEVGWIDFNLSYRPEDKTQSKIEGLYGTIPYTAPELLGESPFIGDRYKLDIWALGCIFYRLYYRDKPKWQRSEILKHYNPEKHGQWDTSIFKKCIAESVEKDVIKLKQKPIKYFAEKTEELILDMLSFTPTRRPTILEIVQKLDQFVSEAEKDPLEITLSKARKEKNEYLLRYALSKLQVSAEDQKTTSFNTLSFL